MSVEWRFEHKRRSQKSRDPMQASFFTNSSIDDDTHALVREAIQNSLDASIQRVLAQRSTGVLPKFKPNEPEPVRVRFCIGVHESGSEALDRYLPEDAWRHFNAADNGLSNPPSKASDCRYLVYEDFNTVGLVGDDRAFEEQPGNAFYFFMRAEGQSGKQEGDLGRHGIGKYVFPYTSGIRMIIVATVRADDGRYLIAGQSVLKSHTVEGERYTPDGWWGTYESESSGDYSQLPVENTSLFNQLKIDFGLARTSDDSGLSVVMPYVAPEVSAERIAAHVIREYFWPITKGDLLVEVVEADKTITITSETINQNLGSLLPEGQAAEIKPYTDLAHRVLVDAMYKEYVLQLPPSPEMPKWSEAYLSKQVAKDIQKELVTPDAIIRVRCPLYVKRESAIEHDVSHLDIFLARDDADAMRKPQFMREGILVPEDRVPKVRGYTSVVVIDKGALATLLGDSENPAHTEWEKHAAKFKGKYRWGAKTIDFVRMSVTNFLRYLSQGDEDEDVTILSDIFYVDFPENDDDVPPTRKKKIKPEPGPTPDPKPDPDAEQKTRSYRLTKAGNGFLIKGPTAPLGARRTYKVKVAYDIARANKARALKQWDKRDFDLSAAKGVDTPAAANVHNLKVGGNTIQFEATSSDFEVSVNGFDSHRDIIVDVGSYESSGSGVAGDETDEEI